MKFYRLKRLPRTEAYKAGDRKVWRSEDGNCEVIFVRRAYGVNIAPHYKALLGGKVISHHRTLKAAQRACARLLVTS
jgi:hypothetical protein